MPNNEREILLPPSASALIESLRGMAYTLSTAIADIVDNSISAEATAVRIRSLQDENGTNGKIVISDNGYGMTREELIRAMALGSISPSEDRSVTDLGRFGLGLKTASFSQCRRLTVISKKDDQVFSFTWDLDYLLQTDDWTLIENSVLDENLVNELDQTGTIVVWEKLDRVPCMSPDADFAEWSNEFSTLKKHLQLTFHRFIQAGELQIFLNNRAVRAWDPFFSEDPGRPRDFPEVYWPITSDSPLVTMQCYVLPENNISKQELFGPDDALNLQGFFIYRGRRLICAGGWLGLKGFKSSEQYRFARIRIDFENGCDTDWKLDIKKSTATPPLEVRDWLSRYAIQARTVSENLYIGTDLPQKSTVERSSLWSKGHRGDPLLVNVADPVIQTLFDKLKQGGLTPDLLTGYLELIALSHPNEVKKSKIQPVSLDARKALGVIFDGLVQTFGVDMARTILKHQKPFANWGVVKEILGEDNE